MGVKMRVAGFGMKWFLILALVVGGLGVVGIAWDLLMAPVQIAATTVSSAKSMTNGVIRQTLNADNALDKYRRFHNLYQGMQKNLANFNLYSQKVKDYQAQMGTVPYALWGSSDKNEFNFIKDTRSNFKLAYNNSAAKYNELAERLDSGLFRGWSLPQHVDLVQ